MTLTQILIENSKKNEYAILTKDVYVKFDTFKQEYINKYSTNKNKNNKIADSYAYKKTLEWLYNSDISKNRFIDYDSRQTKK